LLFFLIAASERSNEKPNKLYGEQMINLKSISKNVPKKPRIIIYGPSGIGKSTFGASAPNPIFIVTEDGLGDIEVPRLPKEGTAPDFNYVLDCLSALATEDHDYKTVVIDSLDWLEPLIWDATCKRLKVDSIESPGYGRGYVETTNAEWKDFFDAITYLRDTKNMNIIMIAHSAIVKIEDPIHPAYDKSTLKLHKRAAAKAEEYADIIGFCALRTLITSEKEGFNNTRNRAVSTGERIMYLSPTAGFVAKNRFKTPDVIPLDWAEIEQYLPKGNVTPKEQTNKQGEN
jgi:hypothetical protein